MFFDVVRNNKRVVQVFLALITLPFAFWGVDSYVRNSGAGTDLASVGDSKITRPQFDQAWRVQQDRMRQVLGANFRPESMNTPEAKLAVLNSLVDQRLLLIEAAKDRLGVGDDLLREVIGKIPALQENGQFSLARYRAVLAAQGMSQSQFEAQVRQDLTLQQLVAAIGDTGIASTTTTDAVLRIQSEERQFAEVRFTSDQFVDRVKIDQAAVRKFYDDNTNRFAIPEQVRAEFAVLSLDSLLEKARVTDADVMGWYESHKDRYQQPEERRASHILILANADVDKDKARAKAEEVLKEVQKSPDRFAELAKQQSQDPGSAEKGGDLGFFGRGMMVKAFEDTVFKAHENEISGLVQSEFGYHIIKVTGIKAGKQRALADVRPELEAELKRQVASRQFAEAAEAFSNLVYEQPDSLQPAAERFQVKLQQSGWLPRNAPPEALPALGQLNNPKVLAALFSEDALKNKRNTEALEIAPNTLLAARVIEHRPASIRPFDTVKGEIEAGLRTREAAVLARQAGEAQLNELQHGEEGKVAWSPPREVSRLESGQLPAAALKAIFKADVRRLPAYAGAEVGGGNYMLYKILRVSHPDKVDANRRAALQREHDTILAQEDFAAYVAGLRLRYKIDINKSALETKER